MEDPAVKALIALLAREGGETVVATTIGANAKSLWQVAAGVKLKSGRPRGVGRDLREKLQRHYPGWLELAPTASEPRPPAWKAVQSTTPSNTGQAQELSYPAASMLPPRIEWEMVLSKKLPREFESSAPDNAMAPEAPKGSRCIFITGVKAEPGDWVMVVDKDGAVHLREFRQVRGALWEAHALNSAFLPLQSDRDGLRVLAVLDGIRGRKSVR